MYIFVQHVEYTIMFTIKRKKWIKTTENDKYIIIKKTILLLLDILRENNNTCITKWTNIHQELLSATVEKDNDKDRASLKLFKMMQ